MQVNYDKLWKLMIDKKINVPYQIPDSRENRCGKFVLSEVTDRKARPGTRCELLPVRRGGCT